MVKWNQQNKRQEIAKQSFLSKLLSAIPLNTIHLLLFPSALCSKAYYIPDIGADPVHPNYEIVPWPIIVACTCFAKKHVPPSNLVSPKVITQHIANFESKLHWLYHFRGQPARQNLYGAIQIQARYRDRVPKYAGTVPTELTAVCSELRRKINTVLCRSKHFTIDTSVTNFFKLVRKLTVFYELAIVVLDKDGGFAIMPARVELQARSLIMQSGDYAYSHFNKALSNTTYKKLCSRLGSHFEEKGLCRMLMSSVLSSRAQYSSVLNMTCKTHKSPVSFRNLHASQSWAYGGLSKFVSNIIQEELWKYPHVLRDCDDFVRKLSSVKCKPTARFCKLDVKHFFMSGNASDLTRLTTSMFVGAGIQDLIFNSVFFLLDTQLVVDVKSGTCLKVIIGSGMGLPHSGAVAEASFLMGAESKLIERLAEFEIDFYGRFKDDVLIVFNSTQLLQNFVGELKQGHPFKIECESISTLKASFLEVAIWKSKDKFEFKPVSKPSALKVPWLSRQSAHHKGIHNMWPATRLCTRLKLCSNLALAAVERNEFIARAKKSGPLESCHASPHRCAYLG